MEHSKIGVIVDDRRLARWQVEALRTVADKYELLLYNCTNTRRAARSVRHAAYFLLNLLTIRNRLTKQIAFPADIQIAGAIDFEANYERGWQSLPDTLLERIAQDRPAVLLKFGMGLLRVPDGNRFPVPILSYHHGDPRAYRGRPAGFYEILQGADRLGQVVQVLSNQLDAGPVAAFAETRIHRHSYRATLLEALSISPLLLDRAIDNVVMGRTTTLEKGKAYRLPSTPQVVRFCAKLLNSLTHRLLYGAVIEKRWNVAQASTPDGDPRSRLASLPVAEKWTLERLPSGYSFIADPFFHPGGGGILVEGMSKSTGLGEIIQLNDGEVSKLARGPGHWSYPATLCAGGEYFVVPETAQSGPVQLLRLEGASLQPVSNFSVVGNPRLLDPTLVEHEGHFYLFANCLEEGAGVLRLWSSAILAGQFAEHPASPVRISPAGSRMAGNIVVAGKSLWRFGQDFTGDYGDGVFLFEIQQLSPAAYCEVERSRLKFADVHGPHTVNFDGSRMLFDFYRNRVSPFAGARRLRAAITARRLRFSGNAASR